MHLNTHRKDLPQFVLRKLHGAQKRLTALNQDIATERRRERRPLQNPELCRLLMKQKLISSTYNAYLGLHCQFLAEGRIPNCKQRRQIRLAVAASPGVRPPAVATPI